MDFIEYRKQLREGLENFYYQEADIRNLINYVSLLHRKGFPIILDQEHFAFLVGYRYSYILGMSNGAEQFYKEYKISKRSGGFRTIDEPLPDLKQIQRFILDNILVCAFRPTYTSRVAKAFIPHKDIKQNASFHVQKRIVVCLDIHDFFGSIKLKYIYKVFENFGYSKPLCVLFSHLCSLNGVLPQGAPTSPMLSNLVFKKIDENILSYCRLNSIVYTRYADDMIFSAETIDVKKLIAFVRLQIKELGLKLNEKKTKVLKQGKRQVVTGIVVNEKTQATKEYRKTIRQEIYYIKRFGLISHILKKGIRVSPKTYIRSLIGKVYFVLFVNGMDTKAKEQFKYLNYLLEQNS